mmetsp:Transcript_3404/g.2370  ORF Transcript_3404/g.2370 Transcript_3404/m.2370 type:complete len:130 (+) Transcript_3404:522-911(+)
MPQEERGRKEKQVKPQRNCKSKSNQKVKQNENISPFKSSRTNQNPKQLPNVKPSEATFVKMEEKLSLDHLKSAIKALNEKLKFFENVDEAKELLQDQLQQSDLARAELRANIKETAERVKEEKDKSTKY